MKPHIELLSFRGDWDGQLEEIVWALYDECVYEQVLFLPDEMRYCIYAHFVSKFNEMYTVSAAVLKPEAED